MQFSEDSPAGKYIVNAYSGNSITINQQIYNKSIYVSADKLIENIPLLPSDSLCIDSIQFLLDLHPELLLLGTGQSLRFPPPEVIALFAKNQIGFEVMNHAAACRTFAVLATEQRKVGALLLLDPQQSSEPE